MGTFGESPESDRTSKKDEAVRFVYDRVRVVCLYYLGGIGHSKG